MSTIVMAACWPLQMPPSPKAVLISMADNANDDGEAFPSIAYMCKRTCLGKTAVIEAIKYLEQQQLLVANRNNGRHTRYRITVTLDMFGGAKPVRHANRSARRTGSPDEPDRSASRTAPVRQADTNRQEPSRTEEREQARERADSPPAAKPAEEPKQDHTYAGAIALALRRAGVTQVNPSHPRLVALIAAGVLAEEFRDVAAEIVARSPVKATLPYVLSVVEARRREAATVGDLPAKPPSEVEQANRKAVALAKKSAAVIAEVRERRARAGPDETPQAFRDLAQQLGITTP